MFALAVVCVCLFAGLFCCLFVCLSVDLFVICVFASLLTCLLVGSPKPNVAKLEALNPSQIPKSPPNPEDSPLSARRARQLVAQSRLIAASDARRGLGF